jgi:peptidoglycan DL-endopeptidase CwlO
MVLPSHGREPGARRPTALGVIALALILGAGTAVPASADPIPSEDDVDSAQQDVAQAVSDVAAMDVQIAQLEQEKQAAQDASALAGETYNQAVVDYDAAVVAASEAKTRSDDANERAEESRKVLVGLARDSSRNGGGLEQVGMYLSSTGVEDAVTQSNALNLVGSKADQAGQQYEADSVVAQTLQEVADTAVADQNAKKDAAETALADAQAKQTAADAAVASASTQQASLVVALAAARDTSVEVEQARQDGLAAQRTQAAEAAARDRVAGTPVAPVATAPADPAPSVTAAPTAAPTSNPGVNPTTNPTQNPTTAPTTDPVVPPTTGGGGSSSGSAAQGQAAVNWAMTQLGKPYLLGATGPDAYDCSGMTMSAWAQAGVSIQRTSRSQYTSTSKVALSSLRPGDLVFWASNTNDPSTIYHVALYAGNNQMIEAARPGVASRLTSMRWDSNLMAFGGRP